MDLKDGVPCGHPGCEKHITHSCEGCGRIGASSKLTADRIAELEAENKKLSAFITMEHTDPPYDYGDSQDVQFAIRIAELEVELDIERDLTNKALDKLAELATNLEDQLAAAQERERVLNDDLKFALELAVAYAPNIKDQEWAAELIEQMDSPLEAQLAFANATVSALRGQLESTTAERDAAQELAASYRNALMAAEAANDN
jgi:hypothetical protein